MKHYTVKLASAITVPAKNEDEAVDIVREWIADDTATAERAEIGRGAEVVDAFEA